MSATEGLLPPRYADVRRIGHGGMGDIFAAEDRELGRPVAIKLLAERYASDREIRERFKREALTAARLSGFPHIVTIYDVGEWADRPFIVMELLTGGSLAERAREAPVSHAQALDWLEQAAGALDAAHAEGIVHRDVKPANLLFDGRGSLTVADFGIARVLDESGQMTQAGTVLGTAGYLSPEQASGEPASASSDVYSLGIVAYELLTGGRPFERASTTAEAAAHIHEPVPSASARGVGLPRALDPVFERALAKDPRDRPGTARELVEELRDVLQSDVQETSVVTVPYRRPVSRRPGWLIPVGLALVLAGGAVAAALVAGGDDPGTTTRPRVITQRVTQPGTTVLQATTVIVTTAPEEEEEVVEDEEESPTPSGSGHSLNDQGFALMQAGRYEEALPVLEQAVQALSGTGPGDPYEAYANYNLGYTLLQVGRCDEALGYLDRSEELQGERKEITRARKAAERC